METVVSWMPGPAFRATGLGRVGRLSHETAEGRLSSKLGKRPGLMGLTQDIQAASSAAANLEADVGKQVVIFNSLQEVIASSQTTLNPVLDAGETSCKNLGTTLTEVDTAVNASFVGMTAKLAELQGRVSRLQSQVNDALDHNHNALKALVGPVQESFEAVEKGVTQAVTGLKELVIEDERLVESVEKSADQAADRAGLILLAVQTQSAELASQAAALTGSWDQLRQQLEDQLAAIQSAFEDANKRLDSDLTKMLSEFDSQVTSCDGSLQLDLVETTRSELQTKANALGQLLTDLAKVADGPDKLGQDMVDHCSKLANIGKVFDLFDNIHNTAGQRHGLFNH